MDNMAEMRNRMDDGTYKLTLEIADKSYFGIYENVNQESGEDIVRKYLIENDDDGDMKNVKINYNKNRHTVKITAQLDYLNGEHKDYPDGIH